MAKRSKRSKADAAKNEASTVVAQERSTDGPIVRATPAIRSNHKITVLLLRTILLVTTLMYVGNRMRQSDCTAPKECTAMDEHTEESYFCRTTSAWLASLGFEYRSSINVCEANEDPPDVARAEEEPKKKNFLKRLVSKIKKRMSNDLPPVLAHAAPITEYHNAYTMNMPLTPSEQLFVTTLSKRARDFIPDFEARAAAVPWGGPAGAGGAATLWWQELGLLRAYGKIMKWPEDLKTNFPFQLCSKGCDAEVALGHTLEFREKYRPWLVSPDGIHENRKGFIYFRGYSPTPQGDSTGHAMVWFRPGHHKVENPVLYFRAVMNTLERAVADSLLRSHGKSGKFNVVMDTSGLTFSMLTSFGHVKRAVVMLQDHFPDRLGMIFLANLSKPAEFLYNLVKGIITKEVRDKVVVLSSNVELRKAVLDAIVMPQFVPVYLGGTDDYQVTSEQYYPQNYHCTNEEALEYLNTMPYHAA
jgi:CRAL/TRIO domain